MSKPTAPRPEYRSPSGRYWEWAAVIAEAKRHPNVWWLVASSVSHYAVRLVNERRSPALHRTDGRLSARAMNPHTVDGQIRVDLLVCWRPYPTERNTP